MVDLNERHKPEVNDMIKDTIENPHKYVMKPQKEGGGNNLFGDEMKNVLVSNNNIEQYLLMKMIDSPVLKTLMLRRGKLEYVETMTELGVFSMVICDQQSGELLTNVVDGLLPRTKQAISNEGGVNAGFAVVDTLILVDE